MKPKEFLIGIAGKQTESFRVIEYSAYEELEKENAELKLLIEHSESATLALNQAAKVKALQKENAELDTKLKAMALVNFEFNFELIRLREELRNKDAVRLWNENEMLKRDHKLMRDELEFQCGNRCAHQNPCAAREILDQLEA